MAEMHRIFRMKWGGPFHSCRTLQSSIRTPTTFLSACPQSDSLRSRATRVFLSPFSSGETALITREFRERCFIPVHLIQVYSLSRLVAVALQTELTAVACWNGWDCITFRPPVCCGRLVGCRRSHLCWARCPFHRCTVPYVVNLSVGERKFWGVLPDGHCIAPLSPWAMWWRGSPLYGLHRSLRWFGSHHSSTEKVREHEAKNEIRVPGPRRRLLKKW